jgi:Fe-S oxidoreductase
MRRARQQLITQDQLDPDDYRLLQVDREWHLFSIYRQAFGIDFSDLQQTTCDALFFPGCTLSSYAPELTRSVHSWLTKQGMAVGVVTQCCGVPLASIGLEENNQALRAKLRKTITASGATRLITTCPNCYYHLQNCCDGVEVVSLYQLLLDAGIRVAGPVQITVHDSCMDRFSGELGRIIRELACGYPLVEMQHHGQETICCGAGGNVSLIDPELSDARARERVEEYRQTSATYCVTACMGCTRRLVAVSNKAVHQNGQQHSIQVNRIVHILELIFSQFIDHNLIQQRIGNLWQGEQGIRSMQLLQEELPLPPMKDR